jgi:multimeric flavodoxin WrbA
VRRFNNPFDEWPLYILGLSGSPRRHANSETLLDEALRGAAEAGAETDKIIASTFKKLRPCINCAQCLKTGVCRVKDEMQEIYPLLDRADGLVVASPIYFMGVSAFLKTLIDRCQCYWSRKYVLRQPIFPDNPNRIRKGIFISTGGHDKPVIFKGAKMTIRSFFDVLEVSYLDEYFAMNMEEPTDILNVEGALSTVYEMGRHLVKELGET